MKVTLGFCGLYVELFKREPPCPVDYNEFSPSFINKWAGSFHAATGSIFPGESPTTAPTSYASIMTGQSSGGIIQVAEY